MSAEATQASSLRRLGRSGLLTTPVGIGGSPLGGMKGLYGHDTSHEDGVATAVRALTGPFTLLDTSNAYGNGRSEQRIGEAIRDLGGVPDGHLIATKVDADPTSGAFDRDRVLRSFEESTERLGLDRIDLLHLHDPEGHISVDEALGRNGAIRGLLELRDAGLAGSIGIAGGAAAEMTRYVETDHFDVVLTHNRWTLVDRTADELLDRARTRNMGVINAAPFGGGALARRPRPGDRYAYGLGTAEQVNAAERIATFLSTVGIPIAAAALQFSVRESRIDTTLIGASNPGRIDEAQRLLDVNIPDEVWAELDELTPARTHWIND
ncbi:aldo/keto reductase [Agromyces sp. GXS1127]|uniref:aldo/keto reductase n=1 Tax=Agromyces sp. GXS1127 TaxID=3424181 RepID=UPI003D31C12A